MIQHFYAVAVELPNGSLLSFSTMGQTNHIVLVPFTAWSHLRLRFTFSFYLLLLHPSLANTVITSVARLRLNKEVALQSAEVIAPARGKMEDP